MSDKNWDALGQHPAPGETIGGYTLEAQAGAGGMASVYRARSESGSVVAVKILNPARVLPEERRRFTREYNALARMNHPNIVQVFEAGVHAGYPWIAMEYVDGLELETLLEQWAETSPEDRFEQAERILRGLCKGLDYVHQTGLIHRDLKPSNVLVSKEGVPKISDFGVVKDPNSSSTQLTMAGRLVGTVAFMAPELIAAEEVDQRADLYALGAVLYLLLTGKRPIEASSVAGYLARHLTEVPKAPSQHDPNIPKRLESICQRLLLKDPAHRFPTAQAILDTLNSEKTSRLTLRGQDQLGEQWHRRVAQVRDGAGGVVILHGPPGIGKSSLLERYCDTATGLGMKVATPAPGEDSMLERLATSLELNGNSSISRIVEALSTGDWLIAIDDLDEHSHQDITQIGELFREALARKFLPTVLLATTKTTEDRLTDICNGATIGIEAELLPIPPIDSPSTIHMLRDLGLSGALCSVIGRRLCSEYGGNPGVIIEQFNAMINEGWLEKSPLGLRGRRPIEDFRSANLPLPPHRRDEAIEAIDKLGPSELELVELAALFDRPVRTPMLFRAHSSLNEAAQAFDALIIRKLMVYVDSDEGDSTDDQPLVKIANPTTSRVLRDQLERNVRVARHGAIAKALAGKRRRSASVELAQHLIAAELPLQAYPVLINAARRAARARNNQEVFALCEQARSIQKECESRTDYAESIRLRRWLYMLLGEAYLHRSQWQDAADALERAIAAARLENDPTGLAKCLSAYGRALYRLNRLQEALIPLQESLKTFEPGAPESAGATRVLADIALQDGKLDEAEHLWNEAMDNATASQSIDGQARAYRGIAHLRALQHRYVDASQLLDRADEMLLSQGETYVRCGIMARSIELDLAGGRYASALHRAENLIQLSDRGDMPERLSSALVLQSETYLKLGLEDRAQHAVQQALLYATSAHSHQWAIKTHSARILLDLNLHTEADEALVKPDGLIKAPLHTPAVQVAALRARLQAVFQPSAAKDLANWALAQPKPPLNFRAAQIDLDIAKAFLGMGLKDHARKAAKSALKLLQVSGTDGLRLEVLLCLAQTGQNDAIAEIYGKIALKIYESLPKRSAKSFANRPFIADALDPTR
jgi:serine/threonine protein kinase/tetratricopeptide (TPR) repeat protein